MTSPHPVIVRLQGGLGNQLYQYACGRAVALKLGRELLYDTRTIVQEAHGRNFTLPNFRFQARPVAGHDAWCVRWMGSVRAGRTFRTFWPPAWRYRYLRDRETGFDPSVFEDWNGPVVLHGYWQSFRYFDACAQELRGELAFRAPPSERNAALAAEIASTESVAVHVRRGDYITAKLCNQITGTPEPSYYPRAAEWVASRAAGEPVFFLFSDEPDWVRANLRFPGRTVYVEGNSGASAAEDLRLMSLCRHCITANSSFSWWGAWLGASHKGIVVCPQRWFLRDGTPPEDRIPAHWNRL